MAALLPAQPLEISMFWLDTDIAPGTNAMVARSPYLSLDTSGAPTSAALRPAAVGASIKELAHLDGGFPLTNMRCTNGAVHNPVLHTDDRSTATVGVYDDAVPPTHLMPTDATDDQRSSSVTWTVAV